MAIALVSFFPCLFLGKAYFANDLLNQYSHFRALLRTQLEQGHFPLWNPYFFGGQPFFADPNVMMTYPLNYLTLLFPVPLGLGVFFFLHMFLAALGMHLWLKALRLSETACRIGALTFALSGFFWWELIHPPILAALALFPWLMACLEKLQKDLKPSWAFLSGVAFALIFCCGNFQSTSCVLYTALAYFFFRVFFREPAADGSAVKGLPWKKLIIVLLFSIWGGLPLAAHLIPANEFSQYSNRRSSDQTYDNFNGTFSMRPASTYEFLFPTLGIAPGDTIENAIQQITDSKNIDNQFLGAFGYLGIWIPVLLAAAFRRKDKKLLYFLLGMGLLSILTAWGRYFPLHQIFCNLLPTINLSRAPFRFVQTYLLFACVLAAFGYQTLERLFQEKDRSNAWLPYVGIYILLLGIIGAFRLEQTWREILALSVGAFGLGLWGLTDSWQKMGRWFFQGALILPLLLSGWSSFSLGPQSNFDLEKNFPTFSFLRDNIKGCRYYFDQRLTYPVVMNNQMYAWIFPQDGPLEFGIRMSNGYNPIILKKSNELQKVPLKNFLRLMAVKSLIFGENRGELPGFTHQALGSVHLYGLADPPAYVRAPYQTLVLPDGDSVLGAMARDNFDPDSQAFFEEPLPPEISSQLTGAKAKLSYEIQKDEMDDQTYKITLDHNSLVSFSEVMFPGWKAFLDGKPSPLLTSDHIFRTVLVPAGEHLVEFRFEPRWFKPLLALGFLWFLSALTYGFWIRRNHPKAI